jgi:hypothetical protein
MHLEGPVTGKPITRFHGFPCLEGNAQTVPKLQLGASNAALLI